METPRYFQPERPALTCSLCGASVTDATAHNRWHMALTEAAMQFARLAEIAPSAA